MIETGKKATLAVSYGTAYRMQYERTVNRIEHALAATFPERQLFSAWTSPFMRNRMEASCGMNVDSVEDAVQRMSALGVEDVIIQFLLVAEGEEYERAVSTVKANSACFARMAIGRPLLSREVDAGALAEALSMHYAAIPENEMLAFMAHGTPDADAPMIGCMNGAFRNKGLERFAVGTLEGRPGIEPVLAAIRGLRPKTVTVAPFMIAAGKHTLRDMAGEGERSWKSIIAREEVEVHCILSGLGEYAETAELFVRHAKEAEKL